MNPATKACKERGIRKEAIFYIRHRNTGDRPAEYMRDERPVAPT